MLALISWIVFGLMVGALARLVLLGTDCMGWFTTLAVCVAGSVIGGYAGSLLWGGSVGLQPGGLFLALILAILLLLIALKIGRGTAIS
jgi:uncharacterized membrane protein YeaQ/YmgE (transglycosylase-associated protein family)